MAKTQEQSAGMTALWRMALHQPQIDADALADAVDAQLASGDLDYRTRLLIRRSSEALRDVWGQEKYDRWVHSGTRRDELAGILREHFEEPGFTQLARSVVMSTQPQTVKRFLRELGELVHEPTRVAIGGSIALILRGLLVRQTEDIDIVDEVPASIRSIGKQLRNLTAKYRLTVGHFQSHYLPVRWDTRLKSFEVIGKLHVLLVDPYDIFVGKLFSRREKDQEDLRALADELDKDGIVCRLADARSMLEQEHLRELARHNWYILFGEDLPDASHPE